jgi:membrane-associated phospholipid phosphatase
MAAPLAAALAIAATAGDPAQPAGAREVYRVYPAADAALIAAGAAGSFVPWLLEDHIIDPRCPCDRSEVPRFERFAIGLDHQAAALASDVTLWLSVAGPLAADLVLTRGGPAFWQDTIVFAQALLLNGAIMNLFKYTLQRPIPLAYAGDPEWIGDLGSYRAFYSGHVSTVFTALTAAAWTIRLRHGEQVWPWIVAGAVGTSVGVERVLGGHHFPSDALVGALAGAAIGTAVPLLHARRDAPGRVMIVPQGGGIAVVGRF